ncbi:CdaR family transcriptional regulator [Clostridium uliginosum]|uniref:Carbohydrate diacid regulator n=1 Tax=Clostridium uliginosum TaxID=119641 RepID=A0A1I1HFU0_9CLOT|nr:sugar diacid recognition domain-containing protein [Clostridium uliginosum]SFC23029.1 carbohydrate diacid regulator [Clostridium uliginosum]
MLSKELAQNIVNKMMEVIPYNVNIMNNEGFIIGSGDLSRVGSLHEGALDALRTKETAEVFEDYEYTKAGVNTPIFFRNKVVGVIGITGLPDVVRPFGQLVSVTAELLISQEYALNEHVIKQKLTEEFIYEWINNNIEYHEDFIQRGTSLGIDVKIERIIAVIQYEKDRYKEVNILINKILKDGEYSINISSNRIVVLLIYNKFTMKRIFGLEEKIQKLSVKIGIGRFNKIIMSSLIDGVKALNIGSKLYEGKNIYTYDSVKFFKNIELFLNEDKGKEVIEKILEEGKGMELLETFLVYMDMNGEKIKASNKIHIHRNTLNYRLDKIEEITGLKFDNYLELFQLITAYIGYKLSS